MEQDERESEVLRRRLYRPGASVQDIESYLDAAPAEEPAPAEGPSEHITVTAQTPEAVVGQNPPRRRWPFVVAGATTAAVVLAGAALAVGALAPPPTPVPSALVPTADAGWTSAPRDPGDSLVATAVDDGGSRPGATGRAVPAADEGYLYTVAAGDTVLGIATRFRLCAADVLVALPYGADPRKLQTGQRLLLERGAVTPSRTATPGTC